MSLNDIILLYQIVNKGLRLNLSAVSHLPGGALDEDSYPGQSELWPWEIDLFRLIKSVSLKIGKPRTFHLRTSS